MITFEKVTKVYPRSTRAAIDDVSLLIDRGEFVFIVGPSGSGKSTMLRLILREEAATTGSVFVAGYDLGAMGMPQVPRLRREMGAVFQDFRLLPNKTVYGNVAYALQVIGKPTHIIRQLVPETLEMVGLAGKEKRFPHQLSGGEQQRVAIARAVVNRPQILLCDEPTGNLDQRISLEIVRLLERINRTGTTVVMATHDHDIVNAMRRRVIQLDDGIVVRDQEHASYHAPDRPARAKAAAEEEPEEGKGFVVVTDPGPTTDELEPIGLDDEDDIEPLTGGGDDDADLDDADLDDADVEESADVEEPDEATDGAEPDEAADDTTGGDTDGDAPAVTEKTAEEN